MDTYLDGPPTDTEERWHWLQTALFVVAFNVAAWAGIAYITQQVWGWSFTGLIERLF